MNTAAVGNALYFFGILIGLVIVGFFVFTYLAHCFHIVVSTTAAGGDEVVWSKEPAVDRLGQALHLLYMVCVAPLPGVIVSLFLRAFFPRDQAWLLMLWGSLISFWLLFPLVVVSSSAAPSPWVVLFPPALPRLVRKAGATLVTYLVSGFLIGAMAVAWYAGLAWGGWLLPVAGLVGATVIVLYARLLGRWMWITHQQRAPGQRDRPDDIPLPIVRAPAATSVEGKRKKKPQSGGGVRVQDPWKIPDTKKKPVSPPPFEEKPFAPKVPDWMDIDLAAYGLAQDSIAEEGPRESSPVLKQEPLRMEAIHPEVARREEETRRQALPPIPEDEMKLAQRGHHEPLPSIPLLSGIYSFPWYRTTLHAWIVLAGGLFMVTALLRLLVGAVPQIGE